MAIQKLLCVLLLKVLEHAGMAIASNEPFLELVRSRLSDQTIIIPTTASVFAFMCVVSKHARTKNFLCGRCAAVSAANCSIRVQVILN